MTRFTGDKLLGAGKQWWVVVHPHGKPLWDTASKNAFSPIVTLVNALPGIDSWDAAREQGYRLELRSRRPSAASAATL